MASQIPFNEVDFIDNPEPRCPCVLLVDTSSSMDGDAIEQLNAGIEQFCKDLNEDKLARKRVEVAVITFGHSVETVVNFTGVSSFVPPRFEAFGPTPMGEAVVKGIELLETRKTLYKNAGISFFRPWIFLLTDGAPTDYHTNHWQDAMDQVLDGELGKKFLFFGVAINDADKHKLNEVCPPNRPCLKLRGLSFRELFSWLSSSLKSVSSSNPGMAALALPSPAGWAAIDV